MNRMTLSSTASAVASVGTSFNAAKYLPVVLRDALPSYISPEIRSFKLKLSSVSSATTLTYRISSDAAGDDVLVRDTELDINVGITTATVGVCEDNLDRKCIKYYDTVYVHFKVDAGSVTVDNVEMIVEIL